MPNSGNMFSTLVTSRDKSSSHHFSPHTFPAGFSTLVQPTALEDIWNVVFLAQRYLAPPRSPPPIADSSSIMHVLACWITAHLGLEPIRQQPVPNNVASTSCDAVNIDSTLWPEGHQLRREVRSTAQTGWAQSNWAWCSVGHVNYPGSIHPKPDRAESCFCLGVLRCQSCGKLVRP